MLRTLIARMLDGLIGIVLLVVLFVLSTGGGSYRLGDAVRVSVRSVENPLLILSLLLLGRYAVRHWGPLFGVRQWQIPLVLDRATRLAHRAHDWTQGVSTREGTRFVLLAVVLAFLLKAWFALSSPGFYSGDDVEIEEMTLGVLLQQPWPVWDLRNALFPMAFIYPVQWLIFQAGVLDAAALVAAGRMVVAVLSSLTIWLTWRIARDWWPGEQGWAVVAAILVATTKLQVAFGSSELPRPVSTLLVLFGFLLLQHRPARAAAAGVILGCAACLRFSETVFLIPAAVQLMMNRQPRKALILTAVALLTIAGLVGLSDRWYWGEPFHSLRAIVEYTIVQGLSSRGYEAPWWYVTSVHEWANPAVAVLAVLGRRSARSAVWWVVIPIAVLSTLPHKEARYLLPVTPFLCLMAAAGLRRVILHVRRGPAARWVAGAVLAALILGLVQDVSHYRLPRTNEEVALIRQIVISTPRPAAIVAEQAWRIGGRLYLDGIPLVDLDPGRMHDPGYLAERLTPGACVLIDRDTLGHGEVRDVLAARGFRPASASAESPYVVWR